METFYFQDYLLEKPKVHTISGSQMVRKMKKDMEAMLKQKVEAISVSKLLSRICSNPNGQHLSSYTLKIYFERQYTLAKK